MKFIVSGERKTTILVFNFYYTALYTTHQHVMHTYSSIPYHHLKHRSNSPLSHSSYSKLLLAQRYRGAAINYLVVVDFTMTRIFFFQNTSNIPVDNGSCLNIAITIKIIALNNTTVIDTSVSVLYLLLYYSIRNPPLLCTSCDISKFDSLCIRTSLENSPSVQINPN